MSRIKQLVGLDWFDLGVHVVLTGLLMGAVAENSHGDGGVMSVAALSVVVLAVRRTFALRHRGVPDSPHLTGVTSGEMSAIRFEELEQRVLELEQAQLRIRELEDRLEFAERLLSEPAAERARLGIRSDESAIR